MLCSLDYMYVCMFVCNTTASYQNGQKEWIMYGTALNMCAQKKERKKERPIVLSPLTD